MRKKLSLDLKQTMALQEFLDWKIKTDREQMAIRNKLAQCDLSNVAIEMDKHLKVKEAYYTELLTPEERKLIDFNNVQMVKNAEKEDKINE